MCCMLCTSHSHEINASAIKSGYTIKPHYLPAIDKQKESSLKVSYGNMTSYLYKIWYNSNAMLTLHLLSSNLLAHLSDLITLV